VDEKEAAISIEIDEGTEKMEYRQRYKKKEIL
jgi:hypothetical protein